MDQLAFADGGGSAKVYGMPPPGGAHTGRRVRPQITAHHPLETEEEERLEARKRANSDRLFAVSSCKRRKKMKVRAVTLVLAMLSITGGLRAADNPFIGTWKLNLAKSKYDPGPPPKSQTIKIEPWESDGVKVSVDGIDAQGNTTHNEYSAKYDGKDYAVKGNTNWDIVALKRSDANTVEGTNKKAGKVVRTYRQVVSKDGKSRTTTELTGQTHNITVYDKQ
jgi:hypothetical protein